VGREIYPTDKASDIRRMMRRTSVGFEARKTQGLSTRARSSFRARSFGFAQDFGCGLERPLIASTSLERTE